MAPTSSPTIPNNPPSIAWRTRLAMGVLTAFTDFACRSNGTVNRRLLSFFDDSVPANPTPVRDVRTADITVDADRNLWFRLFVPTTDVQHSSTRLPLIVFFHGGGFAFLSAASKIYDSVCRRFAKRFSAVVASVNYRLAPEHKCPSQYVDGLDVLRFFNDNRDVPDIALVDLSACFLIGDSAGGNIVHHVAKRWAGSADEFDRVRLAGIVVIQPYFGGKERSESETMLKSAPIVSAKRTDWLWKAFLPEGEDRDHEAVNVFGPRDKVELGDVFPKAMVVVGGWDPLKDWQRRYAEGLKRRGKEVRLVEYEEAVHAFYLFPELKEGPMLMEEIKGFIGRHNEKDFHKSYSSSL